MAVVLRLVPNPTVTHVCWCFPHYIARTTPALKFNVPLVGLRGGQGSGRRKFLPNCMENQPQNTSLPPPINLPGLLDKPIDVRSFQEVSFPKFFVIKRIESDVKLSFLNVSPFKINKFLNTYIGHTSSVSRLRDGALLVEIATLEQSKKVAGMSILGTFPISVQIHKTLNTSKGVIFCPDLVGLDEKEILDELKDQNVSEVRCIHTRKDGILKPSPLYILTFSTTVLPLSLFVGYIKVNVRQHIPNPLRCLRCQRFGHTQHTCERAPVCSNCGQTDRHVDKPCDQEAKCLNCGGSHPAWARDCPVWKREKGITEIKIKDKLSIAEARKKYNLLSPQLSLSKSFSEAANTPPAVQPAKEDARPTASAELKQLTEMMALLLAGQKDTREKLEEQSRKIEEQTEKIEEQTKQIELLRAENQLLKNKNREMEKELVALGATTKQPSKKNGKEEEEEKTKTKRPKRDRAVHNKDGAC